MTAHAVSDSVLECSYSQSVVVTLTAHAVSDSVLECSYSQSVDGHFDSPCSQ